MLSGADEHLPASDSELLEQAELVIAGVIRDDLPVTHTRDFGDRLDAAPAAGRRPRTVWMSWLPSSRSCGLGRAPWRPARSLLWRGAPVLILGGSLPSMLQAVCGVKQACVPRRALRCGAPPPARRPSQSWFRRASPPKSEVGSRCSTSISRSVSASLRMLRWASSRGPETRHVA